MDRRISLTITEGSLTGKGFTLNERGRYVIGRANDCDIRLAEGLYSQSISRHHCVLALDPPGLRVRDLGSRNGTFVNGENIGQREGLEPLEDDLTDFIDFELHDGDELRVGGFTFQIHIQDWSAVHDPLIYFPANLN